MARGDIAIVFDCGATNVRVVAIDRTGKIVASVSDINTVRPDPYCARQLIWDADEIWQKMCKASVAVTSKIPHKRIAGVTVTTFGVDGALFDINGEMLYPVISWQCDRTVRIMEEIGKYIKLNELYGISGVYPFSFNTIFKLIWLRETRPELVKRSRVFLFIPSIFIYYLSGRMINDITMAGTSMLTDLRTRNWSQKIFDAIGFPAELMLNPVESGTITGTVNESVAVLTGLPCGTPVVVTGHDTQFALFGSGAGVNIPVLSSGTWEILMARSLKYSTGIEQMKASLTTELDSCPGLYNIGNQWIASGLIEWVRRKYYPDLKKKAYETMMTGAANVAVSCNGVTVTPDFSQPHLEGAINGITFRTTRDDIYRATLTALAKRLNEGKEALEKAGNFNTSVIICVGGGSRNWLWNQMRANATGAVLRTIEKSEATALGASMFVQYAAGNASSPEMAREEVSIKTYDYLPGEK